MARSFSGRSPDFTPEEMALSFVIEGRSEADRDHLTALIQRHRHKEYPRPRKHCLGAQEEKTDNADPDGITHGMKILENTIFVPRARDEAEIEHRKVKSSCPKSQSKREGSGFFTGLKKSTNNVSESSVIHDTVEIKYAKTQV